MTEDDVASMLAPLRDVLAADGYRMSVGVRGAAVEIAVFPTAGACAECLVPNDLMVDIVRDSLVEGSGGVFGGSVRVIYPPQG